MENNEYEQLQKKATRAFERWDRLKLQQKEFADTTKGLSPPTISKIANGNRVGIDTLRNFVQHVESILQEKCWCWQPHIEDFTYAHGADLHPTQAGTFDKIAGIYEMFHRTQEAGGIIKNILQIHADSNVTVNGQWGNTYYGRAHNFLTGLVSINIHKTQEYAFYHQICFNIGNYLMAGGERVERIFAVSTTVSLDNTFSTNLRVLIRRPPNVLSQPFLYMPDKPEWADLAQTHDGLIAYLNEQSILKQTKKVNDSF